MREGKRKREESRRFFTGGNGGNGTASKEVGASSLFPLFPPVQWFD
jgi:hypothetical protein